MDIPKNAQADYHWQRRLRRGCAEAYKKLENAALGDVGWEIAGYKPTKSHPGLQTPDDQ